MLEKVLLAPKEKILVAHIPWSSDTFWQREWV